MILLLLFLTAGWSAPLRLCDDIKPPGSLNPFLIFEWKPDTLLSHIFDGLLGFSQTGQLLPRLATSWEWISPTRLRLHLRQGVRFHNGEVFDAETVRWNFDTCRDLGPRCHRWFQYQHVLGAEVIDPQTVDLLCEFHDETLLHRLAAWSWMVPRKYMDAVGEEAYGKAPIGTGPYRFERWDETGDLVLLANTDYWGDPPSFPDGLTWSFLPSGEQVRRLLDGSLDLLGDLEPLFHRKIQESGVAHVVKADSMVSVNLVFNCLRGTSADVRVRRAVSHGINRDDLIRYVARGNGAPMIGTSMPGQVGYLPSGEEEATFDPPLARRLVEEVTEGKRLSLRGVLDPVFTTVGKALTIQLSKIGIDLELEIVDRLELWRRVVDAKLLGGDPREDLFLFACPNPTYHYYFANSLTNFSAGPFSMWKNPEYDRRFEELLRTPPSPLLSRLVDELDDIVREDLPMLFLYQVKKGYAVGAAVEFHPTRSGMLDLRYSLPSSTKEASRVVPSP